MHSQAFGVTTVTVDEIENNLRFPGQYYDAGMGTHYSYFRDYDPRVGRYLQSDPIGLAGGMNTYGYALQNPVNYYDPNGQFAIPAIIPLIPPAIEGIAGALGGIALGLGISRVINQADNECESNKQCKKATPFQLSKANISSEHEFKAEWGAIPNSRFDICACKDGSVVIKAVGGCGRPGPEIPTDARWK